MIDIQDSVFIQSHSCKKSIIVKHVFLNIYFLTPFQSNQKRVKCTDT